VSNDDDELTGIFDHLTPEDFAEQVGAPREKTPETFDSWVKVNIETTRVAWQAANGQINPIAVLAREGSRWTITPTNEETLGEYVERVRAKARELGATRLYLSRKTLVGNYTAHEGDDIPDIADPAALQDAIAKGIIGEGAFYYAESLFGGLRTSRHGLMKAEGETLGELVEGTPEQQSVGMFQNMLG
jgi:hypothetical protein